MNKALMLLFLIIWPLIGGIASFLIGKADKSARDRAVAAITFTEFAASCLAWSVCGGARLNIGGFCGIGMTLELDGFRFVYAMITSFMWFAASFFSGEYLLHHRRRNRYHMFVLFTLGCIMGVFLSADLFTTFVFFEMMSVLSYVMVIQDETDEAVGAAHTYLTVAVFGGLVTLMGLLMLRYHAGTLDIAELSGALSRAADKRMIYIAGALTFVGFGAKAAVFPMHIWLPTAHPVAPAPSSALLSGVLTKSGLFGVIVLSSRVFVHDAAWGAAMLALAVPTMVLGAVLALFSVNIKRTLACSSMSQIGFIMTGVAMQGILGHHNDIAVRGTMIYMVGHSLVKLVLFLSAGVIHMNTHKLALDDIRGWGRGKPLFLCVFLMGALGLTGFPLWNGYVGKTLIHESIVEHIHHLVSPNAHGVLTALLPMLIPDAAAEASLFRAVEWTFLVSGAMTAAYVCKLFYALFIIPPAPGCGHAEHGRYISTPNAVLLAVCAAILPLLGMFPNAVSDRIGIAAYPFMNGPHHAEHVSYFSVINLSGAWVSLSIGTLIFFLVIYAGLTRRGEDGRRVFVDAWPRLLDLDRVIYRPVFLRALPFIGALAARILDIAVARPPDSVLVRAARKRFIIHPVNDDFGIYREEAPTLRSALAASFAFSLTALGVGVMAVLIYLLL